MEKHLAQKKSITKKSWAKFLIPFLSIMLVFILLITDTTHRSQFELLVPKLTQIDFFESRFLYLSVNLFSIFFPFLFSFDKKVAFYKNWKALFPAIFIVSSIFIVWDIYFTHLFVWGFNPSYLSGISLLKLPLGEWLFFFTVPYACMFIYACEKAYFPRDWLAKYDQLISLSIGIILLLIGGLFWYKIYTSVTFILTGSFILWHFLTIPNTYRTRFYSAFLIILIPFLLVDGILTGGVTTEPIVIYNAIEFMNFRIVSIPIEDAVYGFLLLLGITTLFEHFKLN